MDLSGKGASRFRLLPYLLLLPSLIGMLVFSLLPLVISAFISLTDWNGLDQLFILLLHFVH